eukprot:491248-Pyramimonas_sp.AAC.1
MLGVKLEPIILPKVAPTSRCSTRISACEKGRRQPALALCCETVGVYAVAAVAATADGRGQSQLTPARLSE